MRCFVIADSLACSQIKDATAVDPKNRAFSWFQVHSEKVVQESQSIVEAQIYHKAYLEVEQAWQGLLSQLKVWRRRLLLRVALQTNKKSIVAYAMINALISFFQKNHVYGFDQEVHPKDFLRYVGILRWADWLHLSHCQGSEQVLIWPFRSLLQPLCHHQSCHTLPATLQGSNHRSTFVHIASGAGSIAGDALWVSPSQIGPGGLALLAHVLPSELFSDIQHSLVRYPWLMQMQQIHQGQSFRWQLFHGRLATLQTFYLYHSYPSLWN